MADDYTSLRTLASQGLRPRHHALAQGQLIWELPFGGAATSTPGRRGDNSRRLGIPRHGPPPSGRPSLGNVPLRMTRDELQDAINSQTTTPGAGVRLPPEDILLNTPRLHVNATGYTQGRPRADHRPAGTTAAASFPALRSRPRAQRAEFTRFDLSVVKRPSPRPATRFPRSFQPSTINFKIGSAPRLSTITGFNA